MLFLLCLTKISLVKPRAIHVFLAQGIALTFVQILLNFTPIEILGSQRGFLYRNLEIGNYAFGGQNLGSFLAQLGGELDIKKTQANFF